MEDVLQRGLEKSQYFGITDELKALFELSRTVQESEISEDSFESILKSVGELIDFRSASLFMFSRETGKLDEICTIGHRVDLIDFVEFDMGSGLSAWVAQKKRPILLGNLRKSRGGVNARSFLSMPIVFADEIIGVINLAHDESEAFSRRDSEILGVVSTLFALLLERVNHKKTENITRAEIESLNEQLGKTRIQMAKLENTQSSGNISDHFQRQVANPLAIIAGNAQFLLMTMKNSPASVIRRLKAIDREASNISALASSIITGSESETEFPFDSDIDYPGD